MRRTLTTLGLLAGLGLAMVCGLAGALEITPANPVPPYTLVRVTYADGDSADVVRLVDGMPEPIDKIDCANGTMAFTGPPGGYLVAAFEGGRLKLYAVRIAASPGPGPGPDPPSPPDPPEPPTPGPDLPAGQYGLAQFTCDRAVTLPAAERAHAAALAANYEWGAGQVVARAQAAAVERTTCIDGVCHVERFVPGTVANTIYETVAKDIATRNRALLATDAWARAVGDPLHARLNELRRQEPSIRTLTGYATALREIAMGMRAGMRAVR